MKKNVIIAGCLLILFFAGKISAKEKIVLFDMAHGDRGNLIEAYRKIVGETKDAILKINESEISPEALSNVDVLVMLTPTTPITTKEKEAIVAFVRKGGALFFNFEEERRVKLEASGANDIVAPFGIRYAAENTPVRHNCGAKSVKGDICSEIREIPYSGGRVITGGKPLSYVFDEGEYLHAVYEVTQDGGKIIATGDGMASMFLGLPENAGVRFSGTGPGDSKFWGKDNTVFIQEVMNWLLE